MSHPVLHFERRKKEKSHCLACYCKQRESKCVCAYVWMRERAEINIPAQALLLSGNIWLSTAWRRTYSMYIYRYTIILLLNLNSSKYLPSVNTAYLECGQFYRATYTCSIFFYYNMFSVSIAVNKKEGKSTRYQFVILSLSKDTGMGMKIFNI